MRRRSLVLAVVLLLAAALALDSVYSLGPGQRAVMLRLGRPVAVIAEGSGLHFKLPLADRLVRLDARSQALDEDAQAVVLGDQVRLLITPQMRYRIADPLGFYRATGAGRAGAERLKAVLNAALGQVLARASGHDVTTGRRDALTAEVRGAAAEMAQAQRLGVDVLDVSLLRVDLNEADAQFVYRRMAAAEMQQAAQIRSQGEQRKRDLIAAADRDAAMIRTGADAQAGQIHAQGEAARAAILARAYAQDPAFARFADTLAADKAALGRGTTVVLTPGSGFLRDFTETAGGK